MRILQIIANRSDLKSVFSSEPRPFVPDLHPHQEQQVVRAALRLDREATEAVDVLRGLARALIAAKDLLPGRLRDEVERIPSAFTDRSRTTVTGAALTEGSVKNIFEPFPYEWPLKGYAVLGLADPYSAYSTRYFRMAVRGGHGGAYITTAASHERTVNTVLGGELVVLELEQALSPSTAIRISTPEPFPYGELERRLRNLSSLPVLLSKNGLDGAYAALRCPCRRVGLIAAAMAAEGLS
jgi:hypothetical protein